jgi:ribosomal protein S12 methylthiotransferase accessory factor
LKPYKSEDPLKTIRNIREILGGLDIYTAELPYPTAHGFYSHGVFIHDENLEGLQIGSFGKGISSRYSLASAYGELMERMQNGVAFFRNYASLFHLKCATRQYLDSSKVGVAYKNRLEKENLVLDFIFGPDEKYLSCREVVESCYPSIRHLFSEESPDVLLDLLKNKLNREEILCVPFYNTRQKILEYVPIELIYRTSVSTGMCAGNTPEEAILHGVCEVFERYAVKKIYRDELTPPTIPLDYFQGTRVFDRITALINYYNMSVVIKDCSMGQKLPVLGVLIIDRQNSRYTFNLGADPSPVTAVERCLSEMCQGGADIHFYPLNFTRDPFEGNSRSREANKNKNYFENLYQGRGAWPNSIFLDEPTYPFEGFLEGTCRSDKEDLDIMVEKIHRMGFDLYVRDVSFLGFPSFFVYVPGMSAGKFGYDNETLYGMEEVDKHLPTLIDIKNAKTRDVRELGEVVDRFHDGVLPFSFDCRKFFLFAQTGGQLESLDPDIFLAMVFIRVEDYSQALKYMERFLGRQGNDSPVVQPFHYCLRDYLKLKAEGMSIDRISSILVLLHGEITAGQLFGQFSAPEQIFMPFMLPACFDCEQCPIASGCKHFDVLAVVKRLHEEYKKSDIDQIKNLERVFLKIRI